MRPYLPLLTFTAMLFVLPVTLQAATLTLLVPLEYQVIQRKTSDEGNLPIVGALRDAGTKNAVIEARAVVAGREGPWQKLRCSFNADRFEAVTEMAAGGWHRLDGRVLEGSAVVAQACVEHVGIGEVFVVAGQSNSTNHGEEKLNTQTGRVAAFDGQRWQLANDPQPGASGRGGSSIPMRRDEQMMQAVRQVLKEASSASGLSGACDGEKIVRMIERSFQLGRQAGKEESCRSEPVKEAIALCVARRPRSSRWRRTPRPSNSAASTSGTR